MEEILASIRKIISEDEEAGGEETLDLGAEPVEEEASDDIVAVDVAPEEPELVEAPVEPEPVAVEPEPVSDPEPDLMFVEPEVEPVAPEPAPAVTAQPRGDGIVDDAAAQKAAGALGKLMGSMMVSSNNTLDDVVRELLRPMLKEWLDANLPGLVEAEVSRELDRIRRMAR